MRLDMMTVHLHLQWLWLLPLALPITTVQAEGFTFPTSQEDEFTVGDLVNVTWDVITPRFSLYEVCDTAVVLESNSTNNYSYIWNATRANYRESGCVFELEPLDVAGVANPPNLTSVLFGVSKRYTGDAAPTDYNFGGDGEQATSTASTATATSTSTPTTTTASQVAATTTSAIITASSFSSAHSGLSSAQKVGIGVGVPLGVISICLIGFVLMWYRRRTRNKYQGDGGEAQQQQQQQQQPAMVKTGMKAPPSALSNNNDDHDNNNTDNNNRVSGADTLVSELSSQNYENYRDSRPISELMGIPRAEME